MPEESPTCTCIPTVLAVLRKFPLVMRCSTFSSSRSHGLEEFRERIELQSPDLNGQFGSGIRGIGEVYGAYGRSLVDGNQCSGRILRPICCSRES